MRMEISMKMEMGMEQNCKWKWKRKWKCRWKPRIFYPQSRLDYPMHSRHRWPRQRSFVNAQSERYHRQLSFVDSELLGRCPHQRPFRENETHVIVQWLVPWLSTRCHLWIIMIGHAAFRNYAIMIIRSMPDRPPASIPWIIIYIFLLNWLSSLIFAILLLLLLL